MYSVISSFSLCGGEERKRSHERRGAVRQITGLSSAKHLLSLAGRGRRHGLRCFCGSGAKTEHRVPDQKAVERDRYPGEPLSEVSLRKGVSP